MNQNIETVFDIESKPDNLPTIINKPKPSPVTDISDETLKQDFETSRQNFDSIMDLGMHALEKVLEIAEEGQHPRFFEAAAMMIKNLAETNREYVELHEKLSRIRKNNADSGHGNPEGPGIQRGIIDKAVFIGTASELLKIIKPRQSTVIDAE